ncbi:hypothetical protein [Actinomadura welshii]|uniref:hypothetical protein n=1 Tax=Actinomadura welshii TaxID=3103817 RepID=UPI0003AD197E|nr:hypothetical protein [Actinomadura madurae]
MDEMQMLRKYHDARPGPSPEVVAEARVRLRERARTPARPAPRRRYVVGAAAVATAAVAIVPLGTLGGGSGGSRAYAAEPLPDGRIKVTMDDLTGPPEVIQRRLDGVERKLAALGVKADIELQPVHMRCSNIPRGELDQETNRHTTAVDDGWLLPNRDKRAIFYVHPERVKPGNTLVWTLSVHGPKGAFSVAFSIYQVRGPVKPCDPVPLPQLERFFGGGGPRPPR